jgi:transcriptional regulator with XRE-family HTH domain
MAEKKQECEFLIRIGKLLESKRKALGRQYKSREQFIYKRSDELFRSEEWISLRYLYNIEHGKNQISIEKLIILADALEEDPIAIFSEIVGIYRDILS